VCLYSIAGNEMRYAMFYSLLCQVYVIYISIKLCRIEDLRKSLYVLLMSVRSAFYSVICNSCPVIRLINLLCLIVSRVQQVLCWEQTYVPLETEACKSKCINNLSKPT